MNEFTLIDRLVEIFDGSGVVTDGNVVVVPNGDDAAVVRPPGGLVTLTTDALVENVHFSLRFCSFADVGFRSVAVNLSDLAAMGAAPTGLLVSFIIPDRVTDAQILQIGDGISSAMTMYEVPVLGGNITRTEGPLVISITAVGNQVVSPPPLRSGAMPGDGIWVSGHPGDGAAGLRMLSDFAEERVKWPTLAEAFLRPSPRLDLLRVMSTDGVHAAIDISDGLVADLGHILKASGVGAVLEVDAIPVSVEAAAFCGNKGISIHDLALYGGDDYQLMLIASPRAGRVLGQAGLTRTGTVSNERGLILEFSGTGRREPAERQGWTHR